METDAFNHNLSFAYTRFGVSNRISRAGLMAQKILQLIFFAHLPVLQLLLPRLFNGSDAVLGIFLVDVGIDELSMSVVSRYPATASSC